MNENVIIRKLQAEELELKVNNYTQSGGVVLALYIKASAATRMLNEIFTPGRWSIPADSFKFNKETKTATCTLRIWEEGIGWVEKTFGTDYDETVTDSKDLKGLFSDAFKRTCRLAVGIGTELDTAPKILISKDNVKLINGRTYDEFEVTAINYSENGIITELEITNQSLKKVVFRYNKNATIPFNKPSQSQTQQSQSQQPQSVPPQPQPQTQTPAQTAQPQAQPTENSTNPADYVIPVGFAKGQTLNYFYNNNKESTAKKKGDDFQKIDVFEWYTQNLKGKPEFKDFLSAILLYCAA